MQNPPATIDASVIKNLKAAGAIPVVKTQTVEFAIGGWGTNYTWYSQQLLEYRDASRPCKEIIKWYRRVGWSRIVPAGLGTDTGGSIESQPLFVVVLV